MPDNVGRMFYYGETLGMEKAMSWTSPLPLMRQSATAGLIGKLNLFL